MQFVFSGALQLARLLFDSCISMFTYIVVVVVVK